MVPEMRVAPVARQPQSHLPELDGIRGLAILGVLCSHGAGLTGIFDVAPHSLADKLLKFAMVPLWGGVDLFFCALRLSHHGHSAAHQDQGALFFFVLRPPRASDFSNLLSRPDAQSDRRPFLGGLRLHAASNDFMEVRLFHLPSELARLLARREIDGGLLGRILEPCRRRTVLLCVAAYRVAMFRTDNHPDLLRGYRMRVAITHLSVLSLFWR